MVDVIAKIIEDSVVAGGFILLLWHVLNRQDIQLNEFAKQLKESNKTLVQISKTLTAFDLRLQQLEKDDENAS